jgi:diguanylate cyclase (GGDEF) domain
MNGQHDAHSDEAQKRLDDLRRENAYLSKLAESNAARLLASDAQAIAVRHELEQKRRGFRLMAELAVALGQDADHESVFVSVSRRINATLNMQRTAILIPDGDNIFTTGVLQGYTAEERIALAGQRIDMGPQPIDPMVPILITGADSPDRMRPLREALQLPYLIAAPVMLKNEIAAFLVTGRLLEQQPYLPRLGASDAETVQTVATYMAAILAEYRLREAETMAKHDPLTRLLNLRGTSEQLANTIAIARRGGFYAAVMFLDLDGFKSVNDTYGHAAGDYVLQTVAERLGTCVRESDFVGRIGGDEFLVVLSHVRLPKDARVVARKIIAKINEPIRCGVSEYHVGASVGIAIYPDNGSDGSALIRSADEAMYMVKSKGKNNFAFAADD